jgi:lactoylglutathione lyase
MRIEHLALWCHDLDALRDFYCDWFEATPGAPYTNAAKGFRSCFLSFADGARLELMNADTLAADPPADGPRPGYAHLALSVGSVAAVDELTARLRAAGVPVIDGPRRTGDGYYESVILDPEGNRIEITV